MKRTKARARPRSLRYHQWTRSELIEIERAAVPDAVLAERFKVTTKAIWMARKRLEGRYRYQSSKREEVEK
jgi:hypothetical protein